MSIGLTRIFAKLLAEGKLTTAAKSPSDLLVVIPSDQGRPLAVRTAAQLCARGLKVEIYHQVDKLAKQIRYASRKGIPFVWFPPFGDNSPHEVKDMATGEQTSADPATWQRP